MASQKRERVEEVELDINDSSLMEGAETEFDLQEDWQSKAPPPPGRSEANKPKMYKMRLFIEDDNISVARKTGFKENDPNGVYYKKTVMCKIQDPQGTWQDAVAFYNVSTGIPRGKKLSTMAGLLRDLKVRVPSKGSDLVIARLFIKAMNKLDGPTMVGDCDWSAWDQDGKGDFGAALKVGMFNFPKKADGTFEHVIRNKAGKECPAKLKVNKLFPLAPVKAEDGKANGVAVAPKPVAAPVLVVVPPAPVVQDMGVIMSDDGEVMLDL